MTDAVVFDLDGTLVDIPIDYEKLFTEFKTIMRTDNIRPLVETISKTDAATRDILFKTWEKAELEVLNQVTLKAEGSKIYQAHKAKRKALVTLQGRALVNAILNRFNLSFEVIVTREDTLFRTAQLMKAIGQLNVELLDVLFVGNTEGDASAATEVGCTFLKVE